MKTHRPGGVSIVINFGANSCQGVECLREHYTFPMGKELGRFFSRLDLSTIFIIAQGVSGSSIV